MIPCGFTSSWIYSALLKLQLLLVTVPENTGKKTLEIKVLC
jgi:hypothetical protein